MPGGFSQMVLLGEELKSVDSTAVTLSIIPLIFHPLCCPSRTYFILLRILGKKTVGQMTGLEIITLHQVPIDEELQ